MPLTALKSFVKKHQPHFKRVLVAVSGGADSVALLRLLLGVRCEFDMDLRVVHFDHGLRPCSAIDAQWVLDLCQSLNVPAEIGSATLATSDEATARTARYRYFSELAARSSYPTLVTGHTHDDQAETVLHHIIRGTGLKGLSGIPVQSQLNKSLTLLRPLLDCTRESLLKYLREINQDFRTDPTNAETDYTRNRLRHNVLPILREQFNPAVDDALIRLSQHARETQETIERIAQQLLTTHTISSNQETVVLNCRGLESEPVVIVRVMFRLLWTQRGWPLQNMSQDRWQELAGVAMGQKGSQLSLPGPIHAVKRQGKLELQFRGES